MYHMTGSLPILSFMLFDLTATCSPLVLVSFFLSPCLYHLHDGIVKLDLPKMLGEFIDMCCTLADIDLYVLYPHIVDISSSLTMA